jgi:DUF4097 and DUF4098 domain-containing protein YvlB
MMFQGPRRILSPSVLGSAVVVASTLAAGCVVNVDSQAMVVRDEKRFTVSGTPELRLDTMDGGIEVRSWDRPEVLVEIEKRGPTREAVEALDVQVHQDGDRIEVEVKRPREEQGIAVGWHRSASAKLIVSAPAASNLQASSGDGSIHVEGIEGRLVLRTGDGSIRARDVGGDMTFNTGDGSVAVERAKGRLEAETGDGSVSVSGTLAALRLKTGDGSIVLRADAGTSMTEDWELFTGDGGVTLYLPHDFSADLDASTGDGTIRSDLQAEQAEQDEGQRQGDRRSLRTRLGSGGHTVTVRTNDGSIRVRAS